MTTTEPTTAALPSWEDMSDLDKGAALLHAWKRDWEGVSYAVSDYPARYFDDPALLALSKKDACAHAAAVTEGWQDWDTDEVDRLYYAALAADDARREAKRTEGGA